ncbi:MAG: hypothetical protein Q7S58_07715 [Candidatus Binatus sp.]|uniref:hypothetical protein n=1 Tax=Candidatus Binatus sp. TaxID=2811406 RepID=UPI00271CD74B|nr:hypothetical protein [Candidatus Binatus sp.]MDO8432282.1 hypothetical protein [Candidatus Binatus sp.]
MSDDAIVGFLVAVAVMFIGPPLTTYLSGKRGQMFSLALGIIIFLMAWEWQRISPHISTELHASLLTLASNAYVWLALLGIAWIYFAVGNLLQMRRPFRDIIWPAPQPPLPESFQPDASLLAKSLTRDPAFGKFKAQILYTNNDKCTRLAKELAEILKDANWELTSPPTLVSPEVQLPKGVSLRSSRSGAASNARMYLRNALTEIGLQPDSEERAELRMYDYCFVYFVE